MFDQQIRRINFQRGAGRAGGGGQKPSLRVAAGGEKRGKMLIGKLREIFNIGHSHLLCLLANHILLQGTSCHHLTNFTFKLSPAMRLSDCPYGQIFSVNSQNIDKKCFIQPNCILNLGFFLMATTKKMSFFAFHFTVSF